MNRNKPKEIPVLETPRLRLRPLELEDAAGIFAIHSDPQALEYWGNDLISLPSEAATLVQANLEWVEAGQCYYWAIEQKAIAGLIGTCTLFRIDDQNRRAEAGYILNREYWEQGLMSEAVEVMIDYAFNTLELHRLEADTDPENAASLALLKKFGFKREGIFRERWLVQGKWHDSDMLGLLRSEYSPPKP